MFDYDVQVDETTITGFDAMSADEIAEANAYWDFIDEQNEREFPPLAPLYQLGDDNEFYPV